MLDFRADLMAGAKGLEPSTSAVTGRREFNENNVRFKFLTKTTGSKAPRFKDSAEKLESQNGPAAPRPRLPFWRRLLALLPGFRRYRPCPHCGAIDWLPWRGTGARAGLICKRCWRAP